MCDHRPVVAIPLGDPAGIGPEVIIKALRDESIYRLCRPLLIGDVGILSSYVERLHLPWKVRVVTEVAASGIQGQLDVFEPPGVQVDTAWIGQVRAETGRASAAYARLAVEWARQGRVQAVAAGPQTKAALAAADIPYTDYPQLLAHVLGLNPDHVFLMLVNDQMRVVNTTLHLSLREALVRLDDCLLERAIRAAHDALQRLGFSPPRLAVAGLNPHAGENGLLGCEEQAWIAPLIARLQADGVQVSGPVAADVLFLQSRQYDALIALYHDQAHLPVKLTGFDQGSAFSIGVPLVFATVCHGSALDLAGRLEASEGSMRATLLRVAAAYSQPVSSGR
ncbi:MAG: 4-hydroxythreonine-4-phosphate dehydrogenase PdxA [Alicyclobacillus sp.]|nr:4-hydroxythreonine-4-phosphate dehydrogenase PdxA [Alicyclobacillus sp.]